MLFLIPAIAFALPPQRPEQAPPPPALVNLNVIALDAKGQSVMDLQADDLRVWDNGKPQKISSFRRRQSRLSAPAALGPREYANRAGNVIPHATVILFDQLNTQFADRGYVSNQLVHVLQQFESPDNLYLYLITTNGSLYPVHGLPGNEEDATKDSSWTRDIQTRLNDALRITLAHRPTDLMIDIDARVRATFETLSMVAARLAAVPGRKTIVWLTHGVPISLSPARTGLADWIDYTPYVEQLSQTLDHADVSIYAVQQSPPGTATAGQADEGRMTSTSPAGRGGLSGSDPTAVTGVTGLGSEQTLDEFARLTGGRAWENNDIGGAIKQAITDAKQSYLISYTPPPENWDGKYHKIRVTCARKGVKLQARQGYYAFAEQATAKQEEAAVQAAVQSPFDAAEIGLRATATPEAGNPPVLRLAVRIDLSGVQLAQTGDAFAGELAVRFVEYQDDGAIRQTKPVALKIHLTGEQHQAALKDGFAMEEGLALAANVEKVRLIVFDSASSAIGSLTIPVAK
ncbi:MAG: VWA domain-containing protein [Candidatus Sulfopaludibacter sp.]|nr:VWA domain-containing protein [Candidatus Sulfopaludibacter sp.]